MDGCSPTYASECCSLIDGQMEYALHIILAGGCKIIQMTKGSSCLEFGSEAPHTLQDKSRSKTTTPEHPNEDASHSGTRCCGCKGNGTSMFLLGGDGPHDAGLRPIRRNKRPIHHNLQPRGSI